MRIMAVLVALGIGLVSRPAQATVPVELQVTYTGCSVVSGPLSLGLTALPPTIAARFVFLSPSYPPPASGALFEPEVVFADLRLGDLRSTRVHLQYFRLAFFPDPDGGLDVSQLTWLGHVAATPTACGMEIPNSSFSIDITGTTRSSPDEPCPGEVATTASVAQGSGASFHYRCTGSTPTYAAVTPDDVPIAGRKLVVVSRPGDGRGKTVFTVAGPDAAPVRKGSGTDADAIAAHLAIAYTGTNGPASGVLAVGQGAYGPGASHGWKANSPTLAKYLNPDAQNSGTRATLIKPGTRLKLVARSAGDTPLDLLGAGAPTGAGVTTVYSIVNGDQLTRHCTRFAASACTHQTVTGGTRLVCRDGSPIACPGPPAACLPDDAECASSAACCSGFCALFVLPPRCM